MDTKPLYAKIMEDIEEKIRKRMLTPNDILPSEAEISKAYAVSNITARRALNELENKGLIYRLKGKGSFVREKLSQDTPKLVSPAAEENSMDFVALVMPHKAQLGRAADIMYGLESKLKSQDYYLTFHVSDGDWVKEKNLIDDLIKNGAKGIVLAPVSSLTNIDLINRLALTNYPLVTLDVYFDGVDTGCVLTDNAGGSYTAGKYLVQQGYRNIFFIADYKISNSTTVRDRYFGLCKALVEQGIPVDHKTLITIDTLRGSEDVMLEAHEKGFLEAPSLQELRKVVEEITALGSVAVHTANDYIGIFIEKLVLEMGLRIPEDIAIIGYDNVENSSYIEVPLTTIDYDFREIGQKAGAVVLDMIRNPRSSKQRVYIQTQLIKRKSTPQQNEDVERDAI